MFSLYYLNALSFFPLCHFTECSTINPYLSLRGWNEVNSYFPYVSDEWSNVFLIINVLNVENDVA